MPQTERAYQRQLAANGGFKKPARKTPGKGGARYYKNVGLGFKTPKEAMEGAQPALAAQLWFYRDGKHGRCFMVDVRGWLALP